MPEVVIENLKSLESMESEPIDSIDFAFVEPRWFEALLLAVNGYPSFDVFGSKLMNAAAPAVFDGAGDAYHVSGKRDVRMKIIHCVDDFHPVR